MKILVLHSELGVLRGGGENFTRNLFTAFADRGHEVSAAFVPTRAAGTRYPFRRIFTRSRCPAAGRESWGRGPSLRWGAASLRRAYRGRHWDRMQEALCWRTVRWHGRRFKRRVEAEFDRPLGALRCDLCSQRRRSGCSVARYRPTVLRLPGPVGAELAPALRAVNAVCANGDALKRLRDASRGVLHRATPGVDDPLFSPGPRSMRATLGWTEQHRVAGYVGRLTHLKGVDLLAEAFRQTAERIPMPGSSLSVAASWRNPFDPFLQTSSFAGWFISSPTWRTNSSRTGTGRWMSW